MTLGREDIDGGVKYEIPLKTQQKALLLQGKTDIVNASVERVIGLLYKGDYDGISEVVTSITNDKVSVEQLAKTVGDETLEFITKHGGGGGSGSSGGGGGGGGSSEGGHLNPLLRYTPSSLRPSLSLVDPVLRYLPNPLKTTLILDNPV